MTSIKKNSRRKHLFSKHDRDPNTGFCVTSLWGPFCQICREKWEKELSKKIKNVDWDLLRKKIKENKSMKDLDFFTEFEKNKEVMKVTPIDKNADEEYRKHVIRERSKYIRY